MAVHRITEARNQPPSWFWQQTDDDQFELLAWDLRKRNEIEDVLAMIRKGDVKLWDSSFYLNLILAQRIGH